LICKISVKPTGTKIPRLHVNNSEASDIPDSANSLAQTFPDNSSSEQYSTKFQSFHHQAENDPLNFKSNAVVTSETSSSATAERPRELDQLFQMGGQFEAIID